MKSSVTKLLGFAVLGMGAMGLFLRRAINGPGPQTPIPKVIPGPSNPGSWQPVPMPPRLALDPRRQAVIAIALGELGPQDPDKYWGDVQPRLQGTQASWCGGFALWVLHQAGLTDVPWEVENGFCYRLPTVRSPEPGDIAYFTKNQHHAIVQATDANSVYTIDGNQPGETVAQRVHPKSDVAAYYSINPFLNEATA